MSSFRTITPLILGVLAVFWVSCSTTQEKEEETAQTLDEQLAHSAEFDLWNTILGDFQDAMFRGISFGDSREKVRITETFELFEEMDTHLGYTFDTKDLETVDVYYYFSEGDQVSEIRVDIFLNAESSAKRMWDIVNWNFSGTMGEPMETTPTHSVWESPEVRVEIVNVSGEIDNGLKIVFTQPLKTRLTHN